MNKLFAEAFIHKADHMVTGKRLRPFTLAAWFALIEINSPLLYRDDRAITLADVIIAARICTADNPRLVDLSPTWGDYFRHRFFSKDTRYLSRQAQAFVSYLDDYLSFPEFYSRDDETGHALSAPWILVRVCRLIDAGISPDAAWATPVGEAFWYDATLREMDGAKLRFLYEEDEELGPDEELTEEEIYARAVEHLGEAHAKRWFKARKEQAND